MVARIRSFHMCATGSELPYLIKVLVLDIALANVISQRLRDLGGGADPPRGQHYHRARAQRIR